MLVDNVAERTQALRLCRRLLLVEPNLYPVALARSVVALAQDGGKEKDRLVRASLAHLAELCRLPESTRSPHFQSIHDDILLKVL